LGEIKGCICNSNINMACLKNILAGLVVIFFHQINAQNSSVEISIGSITGTANVLEVDGVNIYYEIYGEGTPLLILHGNGGSAKGRHHMVPELAKDYKVILMDNRCHGKSSCTEELDYTMMARDANSLMLHLGEEEYTIWGHSDGGIIGLILGYEYPGLISRMLISGANLRPDTTALENKLVEFVNRYEEIKDPKLRKQIKLMAHYPNIELERLKSVDVPVMLMVGDRDAIKIEHTIEIFNALPKSNLCVLPGTTHFISSEKPEQIVFWLKELTKSFSMPSTVDIAEEMAKSLFK